MNIPDRRSQPIVPDWVRRVELELPAFASLNSLAGLLDQLHILRRQESFAFQIRRAAIGLLPARFPADDWRWLFLQKASTGNFPGRWVLPGGGLLPGELPEDAVCRETKEETGLKVDVCAFLDRHVFVSFGKRDVVFIADEFLLKPCSGVDLSPWTPIRLSEEHVAHAWLTEEQRLQWLMKSQGLR